MAQPVETVFNATQSWETTNNIRGVQGKIAWTNPILNGGIGVYHRIAVAALPVLSLNKPFRYIEYGWVKDYTSTYRHLLIDRDMGLNQRTLVYFNHFPAQEYRFRIIRAINGLGVSVFSVFAGTHGLVKTKANKV